MPFDLDRTINGLTDGAADGFDCAICGTCYINEPVPHVPVGRSEAGSLVYACAGRCADEIARRLDQCASS
jgi:hypothetical protein